MSYCRKTKGNECACVRKFTSWFYVLHTPRYSCDVGTNRPRLLFSGISLCTLVDTYRRFRRTCCLHRQVLTAHPIRQSNVTLKQIVYGLHTTLGPTESEFEYWTKLGVKEDRKISVILFGEIIAVFTKKRSKYLYTVWRRLQSENKFVLRSFIN